MHIGDEKAELLDVWSHIAEDDIPTADVYLDRIFELCELLADNPLMGVARDDVADGVRKLPSRSLHRLLRALR